MAYQSEIEKLQRRYEEKPEQWFAAYADAYRKAGELDVALEIVRSGIEERPNYVSGYIVLGRCLVDQGQDTEAQEAFEQVLALDAENIIALSNLGEVAERAGDLTGARRWLERLLEVDPMNDKARHSLERLTHAAPAPTEVADATSGVEAATSEETRDHGAPVEEEPPAATTIEEEEKPAAFEQRFAPAEPGPDLVAADAEEQPASKGEEDVSSVFGAAFTPPVSPPHDEAGDPSQFLIERHSDPFETPSEAQEAQNDAAALWASLGEDPKLESVPDAESTLQGPEPDVDLRSPEEPNEVPTFGEADEPENRSESTPFEPSPPVGGTTQMSAADLNALVEREREEARERDRGRTLDEIAPEPTGQEPPAADEDRELFSEPPPEYQLEPSKLVGESESTPFLSDLDLLAADSLEEDVTPAEEPVSSSAGSPMPADEPEPVTPPALVSDAGPDLAEADISEPEPIPPSEAETDDVVTETMAEVYAAQGLFAEAKEVYRKLLERRPDDADVESRLQAVEARERETRSHGVGGPVRAAQAAPREYAASRTGGVSARAFLAELLGERPQAAVTVESAPEPPGADTVLDETFASDRPDSQAQPTGPAEDEMSLASVFGDRTPETGEHRRPSTEQVTPPPPPPPSSGQAPAADLDLSFDTFFSSGSENKGAEPVEEDSDRDDDDEDFKAWLKSLKS